MNLSLYAPLILVFSIIFTGGTAAADSVQAAISAPAVDGQSLRFVPGDALLVSTWPDSAGFPRGFYPIDGDGYVDFPIVGYLKVTDKSPEALSKILSEKYVDFMRYPHMSIRPMLRVSLSGGFYRPGLYWINPHASLWDAVRTAGGTQRLDGFKKMKWERDGGVVKENLVPLLQEGKSLYQIGFKSGDQITVLQQPLRTGWEVFRTDVLPMISFSISTAISVFTLYNTMQLYQYYRTTR